MIQFVFAIEDHRNDPNRFLDVLVVSIATKACWDTARLLNDSYDDDEWEALTPILEKHNLGELMESIFEYAGPLSAQELKAVLEKEPGMNYVQDFQDFIDSTT